MCRAPNQQFQQHGGEVDAFFGEPVVGSAGVGWFGFGVNDAGGCEFAEPVAEDVGGDTFAGTEEIREGAIAADHKVADDQEGPAVAENLKGDVDRATGPMGRHRGQISRIDCEMQVTKVGPSQKRFLALSTDSPSHPTGPKDRDCALTIDERHRTHSALLPSDLPRYMTGSGKHDDPLRPEYVRSLFRWWTTTSIRGTIRLSTTTGIHLVAQTATVSLTPS